MQNSSDSVEHF